MTQLDEPAQTRLIAAVQRYLAGQDDRESLHRALQQPELMELLRTSHSDTLITNAAEEYLRVHKSDQTPANIDLIVVGDISHAQGVAIGDHAFAIGELTINVTVQTPSEHQQRPLYPVTQPTAQAGRARLSSLMHHLVAHYRPGIASAHQLPLPMTMVLEQLDLGITAINQEIAPIAHPLPAETPIGTAFDTCQGSLLIVGGPGSGKSYLLIQLARDLLGRASADIPMRIPCLLNLSNWNPHTPTIAAWMIAELHRCYDLPLTVAHALVQTQQIIPLLDGLDEVPAEHHLACAHALRAYVQQFHAAPIAVACRIAVYQKLPVRLGVYGSVRIEPLPDAHIRAQLDQQAPLLNLWNQLIIEEHFADLARTPLILQVLLRCDQTLLATTGAHNPLHVLCDTYIATMLQRRSGPVPPVTENMHSSPQTHRNQQRAYLTWLATYMQHHQQHTFRIEYLQPDTLSQRDRRIYTSIVSLGMIAPLVIVGVFGDPQTALLWSIGAMLGLVYTVYAADTPEKNTARIPPAWASALAVSCYLSWLIGALQEPTDSLDQLAGYLSIGIFSFIITWATMKLTGQRLFKSILKRAEHFLGSHTSVRFGVAVGGSIAVSLGSAVGLIQGIPIGLRFGGGAGLAAFFTAGIQVGAGLGMGAAVVSMLTFAIQPVERLRFDLRRALVVGVSCTLIFITWQLIIAQDGGTALQVGLRVGGIFGLLAGITGEGIDQSIAPNQGIHRSLRRSLIGIPVSSAIYLLGIQGLFVSTGRDALTIAAIVGFLVALLSGLGAVLQHIILRLVLEHRHAVPRAYVAFLNDMSERLLLVQKPTGYEFWHRVIRDYLADDRPTIDDRPSGLTT